MRAVLQKYLRGTLEQTVIKGYKKQHLNYDQYVNRIRFPSVPKIIVYSQTKDVDNFL